MNKRDARDVNYLVELRKYLGYSVETYHLRDVGRVLCEQLIAERNKVSLCMDFIEELERTIVRIQGPKKDKNGKPTALIETVGEEEEGEPADISIIIGPNTPDT